MQRPLRQAARDSGNATGGDGRARIYEFEAHGKEGWQFTNDAEGWAPLLGRLLFHSERRQARDLELRGQPTVASPDNLNIPTSKFAALRVRMRNSGAPTSAKVSFTTQADPAFSERQERHGRNRAELSGIYGLLLRSFGQCRMDGYAPAASPDSYSRRGDVSIDSIALEETDPHSRNLGAAAESATQASDRPAVAGKPQQAWMSGEPCRTRTY